MTTVRLGPKRFMLMLLMCASAAVGFAARPTAKIADQQAEFRLDKVIPESFGEWREQKQDIVHIINPQEQLKLNEIYSQILSKSYVNPSGYRIMLSIAYGGDQSRDLQLHRPEVCYQAQGFRLSAAEKVLLQVRGSQLPATRMQTSLGGRVEPVTYWLRVGDKLVRGGLEQSIARISYGLQGQIADGLLFRVSSIDAEPAHAYRQQEAFVNDLMGAVANGNRYVLWGNLKPGVIAQ